MSTASDMRLINGREYNENTNPGGLAGVGGMDENFERAIHLMAQALDDMAAYLQSANFLAAQAAVATIYQLCQELVRQITPGSTSALAFPSVDKLLLSTPNVAQTFVYDTRLDDRLPDGGRWNEPGRCSATSYWTEALAVTYRGTKRDFPAVALIVALKEQWYIFDALDLDPLTGAPRLWAASNPTGNGLISCGSSAPITSVYARNGYLYFGTGGMGLHVVSLTGDWCERYDTGGKRRRLGTFAQRNTVLSEGGVIASSALPANSVTSVHAAVLPGAPLDPAGLPIPTIVAATTSGTAGVHPGGQVFPITRTQGHSRALFEVDGTLTLALYGNSWLEEGPVPYASMVNSSWRTRLYDQNSGPATQPGVDKVLAPGARGSSYGLELIAPDPGNSSNSMVAFVGAAYSTGWMPGDCRLALMCDRTVGSISGSGELVVNGTFDSSASNWTPSGGVSVAAVSGELQITFSASVGAATVQMVPSVVGQSYLLSTTYRRGTAGGALAAQATNTGQSLQLGIVSTSSLTNVTHFTQFTAVDVQTALRLWSTMGTTGETAYFDNISVKVAAPDRSYKAKGVVVNGTLQRTPVAAGADMVAWSGFSASNYLEQPYNADLDFGAADHAFVGWFKATTAAQWIFARGAYAGGAFTGPIIDAYINGTGGFTARWSNNGMSTADPTVYSTSVIDGLWHFFMVLRRGNVFELWIDGVRVATYPVTVATGSLSNAAATLRVGVQHNGQIPASNASLSMFRATAYAPTPAQIRKMFADESLLFQDGAKCVLGGTSSNVTALSTCPLTGRRAAGTDDGTSIFAGLRRVSYLDETALVATTSDTVRSVSLCGGVLAIGTAAEVGVVLDAIAGKEAIAVGGPRPVGAGFIARGFTTDATPLDLAPRVTVGDRELVVVEARILGKVAGAADTERLSYVRKATYYRDAGGAITLQGAVQVIGTDTEVTTTADATFVPSGDWVAIRVTGVVAKRINWIAAVTVTRHPEETSYAA